MLMTSSPANKARLLSASAPHARSWLSVIPSVRLGLHLDPAEFQAAVKWWLGMNSSIGSVRPLCPGTTLDPFGQPQCHADMVAMWLSNTMTCKTFLQSSVVVLTWLYVLRLAEAFRESTATLVQQMCLLMGGKGQNLWPLM